MRHLGKLLVILSVAACVGSGDPQGPGEPLDPVSGAEIQKISLADDPLSTGIERCAAMLNVARKIPGVSGVNIRYDGPPEHVIAVLDK